VEREEISWSKLASFLAIELKNLFASFGSFTKNDRINSFSALGVAFRCQISNEATFRVTVRERKKEEEGSNLTTTVSSCATIEAVAFMLPSTLSSPNTVPGLSITDKTTLSLF